MCIKVRIKSVIAYSEMKWGLLFQGRRGNHMALGKGKTKSKKDTLKQFQNTDTSFGTKAGQQTAAEQSRREMRRKRRKRNQVVAVTVTIVVVGCAIFFGLWGTKQIINGFHTNSYNINKGIDLENKEPAEVQISDELEIKSDVVESDEPVEYVRDELDDVVDAYLADMTIEEKVAQMFIITPETLTSIPGPATIAGPKTEAALRERAIGGILFQNKNFSDSTKAKDMITKTYAMGTRPLFTAVFEAGGGTGAFSSSPSLGITMTDSFATIGESKDSSQAYQAGATIGGYLSSFGVMLDLSAVADLGTQEAFSSDPHVAADMVSNYVAGVKTSGVNVCLTHFPGTSQINGDKTTGIVTTEKTINEMEETDFLPFKAGIDSGADFVMVSHVCALNVNSDSTPACMSSTFIDILRNEMGFRGVIITDRMDYPGITDNYSTELATLSAVMAGVDMILCPDDFERAYNALLTEVKAGKITEERIDESLHRIYRIQLAGTVQ